ncbi:putative sulfate exporter family transporter [Gallaecimonas sp. GXIMD4217]|uniref:YeiH family protein n=1 Tax=Gallaecimonas sp. GXIMD4217 TaxID=3131927 RepID=UPI00311ABE4A
MLRGLLWCLGLSLGGWLGSALLAGALSPLVLALVLGLVVGNLRPPAGAEAGLAFAGKRLLRLGVMLLGCQLTWSQLAELGWGPALLDLSVVVLILLAGYWLGTRWLGLDRELVLLTSAGSAICGAAAVLATESTLRARQDNATMAVATVVLFGSLGMLSYPLLYPWLGLDEYHFGIFTGATVHEVAQVVAIGEAVGEQALQQAVLVKLMRVGLLIPFLLLLTALAPRGEGRQGRIALPWFAFGFAAVVAINSLGWVPGQYKPALALTSQACLTMAMAALGLESHWRRLKALGLKPLLLAAVLFGLLLGWGLLAIRLFG